MAYTTIKKPSDYFNTKTYSGNSSTQAITSVNFQPDFTWLKRRDQTSFHYLFDSIRGVQKRLSSNSDTTEATVSTSLTSFDSDGFTLGSEGDVNESGGTYVGWNWLADNTSGSSNTDGSITSTVSANTTSGFSIVSYSGSASNVTVGHGLGVTPKMILIKNRTSAVDWTVYHESLGNAKLVRLNTTTAEESTNQFSFGTSPTSSVFALGGGYSMVNTSGANYIAYCFAEKKGFSKFGSYVGNGSTDGTFVYTGFKPAFTILKRTDATGGWIVVDNKRDTFNVAGKFVFAHNSDAEQDLTSSHTPLDLLSNGMKMRSSNLTGTTSLNISGATYIYMCFAENPLVSSAGVPCTAR